MAHTFIKKITFIKKHEILFMKKLIFFSCILLFNNLNALSPYFGYDYRLFKDTPYWKLAKEVDGNRVRKIKKIVSEQKLDVNFQEPKYGNTLLMLAIKNRDYLGSKTLLELGANPNIHDTYDGSTALIESCQFNDDIQLIKLLLAFGANPNEEETGPRREGNTTRLNPLLAACEDSGKSPIEKVKILVEAGANINYTNEYNMNALKALLIFEHYDVILYLIEKGAEYKNIISTVKGVNYYICDELRYNVHSLNSEKYLKKMELVDFLEKNGLHYWTIPIPPAIIDIIKKQYPNNWQEYFEKY